MSRLGHAVNNRSNTNGPSGTTAEGLVMSELTRRLVSIPDARAELGGIGHTTLYELVKRGELKKVNIGRRGFITAESLVAYVNRLSERATI